MRQFGRAFLIFMLVLVQSTQSANAYSQSYQYKNCKSMQAKYPLGVARDAISSGLYQAKISRAIYAKFKNFDFDLDGIICEKELLQIASSSTTTSTTSTTTLPGMAGGNVPPAGMWEDGYVYDTKELLLGKGYRLYTCASGTIQGKSSLEVQVSGLWVTKALSITSTPSLFCGAAYPILHSYYWIIDVSGPETKTSLKIRLGGFSTSTEKVRTVVKTPSQSVSPTPSTNSSVYVAPTPLASTTTTTSPMPTLSFSEERFAGGTCSLFSANLNMSSVFQCPGLSWLTLYGQPQKSYSFPAIFKRQNQWNGTNVSCSWNFSWALYFCS